MTPHRHPPHTPSTLLRLLPLPKPLLDLDLYFDGRGESEGRTALKFKSHRMIQLPKGAYEKGYLN